MNQGLLWRGIVIAAVVGICFLLTQPVSEKINLGLDLRGGIHLVLEVQSEDALRAETDKDLDGILRELEEEAGAPP